MSYDISGQTRRPDGKGHGPCKHLGHHPSLLGAIVAAKVLAREHGSAVSVTGQLHGRVHEPLFLCNVWPDGSTDDHTWREPRAWQVEITIHNGSIVADEIYGPTLGQALHQVGVAIASGRWRLSRIEDVGKVTRRIAVETLANNHDGAALALARAMGATRARNALEAMIRQRGSRRYATEEEIELRKHYVSEMLEQLADNHTPAEIEQIRRAF